LRYDYTEIQDYFIYIVMAKFNYKLVTSDKELKGALEVRRQVFVDEQGVSEDIELDGRDGEALHMVVTDEKKIIGTARVLFLAGSQAKIERMVILKPFRGRGIGREIISFLNEELSNRQIKQVFLHAQCSVIGFYKSCGFEETGSPFWEAGIKHVRMQRQL
jgi:predicted GNAT family N-acyltransferase